MLLRSLFITAILWLPAGMAVADDVSVAVAANFTAATRRLAPAFEKASGHRLTASFGSTGKLYAQIRNGAPFEILLAADTTTPQRLIADGAALPGTSFTYALGQLALWSTAPGRVDAEGAVLKRAAFTRLAIANPKLAPYGAAAVMTMVRLGAYDRLAPKVVVGENIAQTFQFVSTGAAQLGFVAVAQVMALPEARRGSWWRVPARLYDPIRQDAVLLKHAADQPAARAFMEFLKGPEARRIIQSLGYGTAP
jgi:molybdate transport system substrate-binding protein